MISQHGKPITVRLRKELTRQIKRGHAWLYSDAIDLPAAPAGAIASLLDKRGKQPIATGIYAPEHPIPLRICRTSAPFNVDNGWLISQLEKAIELRQSYFGEETNGFRLVAGEGDGLPGLIIDIYNDVGVMKLDGGGPEVFYDPEAIAAWLAERIQLSAVILRKRGDHKSKSSNWHSLIGKAPESTISFLENGLKFSADVIRGQKTGFFLDQRDNRQLIRQLSKNRTVLNLFSFNGGFSIAAGVGGAKHVTSVDIAGPAIEAARQHWLDNNLRPEFHTAVAEDCFQFLDNAIGNRQSWNIVISDPPSFAPNEKSRERALQAYEKLAQLTAKVTARNGLLALASCSSHVDLRAFTTACSDGLGRARRKATLIAEKGLPLDHPTPLAMPELRYLKFLLLQLD